MLLEDVGFPIRLARPSEIRNPKGVPIGVWSNQVQDTGMNNSPIAYKERSGRATNYLSCSRIDTFPLLKIDIVRRLDTTTNRCGDRSIGELYLTAVVSQVAIMAPWITPLYVPAMAETIPPSQDGIIRSLTPII